MKKNQATQTTAQQIQIQINGGQRYQMPLRSPEAAVLTVMRSLGMDYQHAQVYVDEPVLMFVPNAQSAPAKVFTALLNERTAIEGKIYYTNV